MKSICSYLFSAAWLAIVLMFSKKIIAMGRSWLENPTNSDCFGIVVAKIQKRVHYELEESKILTRPRAYPLWHPCHHKIFRRH